jgi:hypothetical protein
MSVKIKVVSSPVERVHVQVKRPSWREFLEY